MRQVKVYRMIQRRAGKTGVSTQIRCYSFRAAGISKYRRNSGKLEIAKQIAKHEFARLNELYG
jgi:hypothetical protein